MPPLSYLTSCTPTKPNLHLANSLSTVVSEPDLYTLLTFQVPNLMSVFHCLGYTNLSVQVWGTCFITKPVFTVRSCQHLDQSPCWKTTPCRLSATAYSIYLQLPSMLEAVPPSVTWEHSMRLWQGPSYHCVMVYSAIKKVVVTKLLVSDHSW